MVFQGSRLVFHGSRLVFHGSRSVCMIFKVSGWFFLDQGFSWFLWFQVVFNGFSWFQVSFRDSRSEFYGFLRYQVGFSWFQVGFYGSSLALH